MDNILTIKSDNFENAYSELVLSFDEYKSSSTDDELYKEAPTMITVCNPSHNPIIFDGKKFVFKEKNYLLSNQDINDLVIGHYQDLIRNGERIEWVINYLTENLYSKRAILNFWEEKHSDLSITCPCLIYLWFRVYDGKLCLITHLRANDVYNKMLLNFYLYSSLQQYIATKLGLEIGTYHHYIDSAHVYMKDLEKYKILVSDLKTKYVK